MLPVAAPGRRRSTRLFKDVRAQDGYELTISLIDQQIVTPDGSVISFDIDPFLKERLLNGWDQIGLTLRHESKISTYEKRGQTLFPGLRKGVCPLRAELHQRGQRRRGLRRLGRRRHTARSQSEVAPRPAPADRYCAGIREKAAARGEAR